MGREHHGRGKRHYVWIPASQIHVGSEQGMVEPHQAQRKGKIKWKTLENGGWEEPYLHGAAYIGDILRPKISDRDSSARGNRGLCAGPFTSDWQFDAALSSKFNRTVAKTRPKHEVSLCIGGNRSKGRWWNGKF